MIYECWSQLHDLTLWQIELNVKYKHRRMSQEEHHYPRKEKSQSQNQNHRVYHKFFRKQTHLQ